MRYIIGTFIQLVLVRQGLALFFRLSACSMPSLDGRGELVRRLQLLSNSEAYYLSGEHK